MTLEAKTSCQRMPGSMAAKTGLTTCMLALTILCVAAPRGLSLYLALLALLSTGALWLQRRRCPLWMKPTLPLATFWACAGWFLLSTLWSDSPRNWEMARDTAIVTLSASLLFLLWPRWPQAWRERLLQAFALGFICSLGYVLIQEVTDFSTNRVLDHIDAQFVMKESNVPKRMAAILLLLAWPALAYLKLRLPPHKQWLAWLVLGCSFVLLPGLYSRSAMLGAGAGLGLLSIACWRPRLAVGAGLLLLPLSVAVSLTGMMLLPWLAPQLDLILPHSGQERLQIWQDVWQRGIALWPRGAGLDGSRAYTFATHPHNVYLQLFYDGGLLGTLLASLLFGTGWALIRRAHKALQPFLWGFAASQFMLLSIAYGIWQAWWLAGNALAVFLLLLIAKSYELEVEHNGRA